FFFQAEDGIRDRNVTGVQTCALPISDIAEGGHILSVGSMGEILELNRRLEPYKERGSFLPFRELMKLFSEYHVIVGGAHPFRERSEERRVGKGGRAGWRGGW